MGQIMHFKETTFAYIFYIFLFLVSLAQATLTYVIGTNELTKLGFTFNEKKNDFVRILITTMILLISSISLYFVNISLSYLFICLLRGHEFQRATLHFIFWSHSCLLQFLLLRNKICSLFTDSFICLIIIKLLCYSKLCR